MGAPIPATASVKHLEDNMAAGRGLCHHPDGVARVDPSSLTVTAVQPAVAVAKHRSAVEDNLVLAADQRHVHARLLDRVKQEARLESVARQFDLVADWAAVWRGCHARERYIVPRYLNPGCGVI